MIIHEFEARTQNIKKILTFYFNIQFLSYIQHMFDQKALYPAQFPVQQRNRKSTDVCCTILSAILALTLFIIACTMWNRGNFEKNLFNFSSNGKGAQCKDGEVIYYPNPDVYQDAVCTNACPSGYVAEKSLCLPNNGDLRAKYLSNPSISSPYDYDNFKQTLLWTALTTLGIGLIWATLTFCFPKIISMVAHVLGALSLIALGVLVLVLWDSFWANNLVFKIIFAVLCFITAIILLAMLLWWANQRKFQGLMLDYGRKFLSERPINFFYIPFFILLTIGLIALVVWQHCCFTSAFGGSNNFWNFNNSGIWGILNILELIWGLRFLRDAFNLCVSGSSTDWYWNRPANTSCYAPYQRLICKHWGSVAGGSFLNAFFTIPTLIMELLVCHPQACCTGLGTTCYNSCSWLTCFFDLVRTDAYSYMNLSGIPFCNSARQAKKINERNPSYIGSHSPMAHYRFAAHAFLVPITLLASWFILRARVWNPNFWHWIILTFVIIAILSWFINIQADASQGLQTSYLVERQLQNGDYKYMHRLLPSFKAPLEHLERRMHGEGDGFC